MTVNRDRVVDPDLALGMYEAGMLHKEIAHEFGVERSAISHALRRHPDYVRRATISVEERRRRRAESARQVRAYWRARRELVLG